MFLNRNKGENEVRTSSRIFQVGRDHMTKCSFQLRGNEEFIKVLESKREKKEKGKAWYNQQREIGIRSEMDTG